MNTPVCEPTLNGKELEYVTDCIKSNWISSSGKYIERFEKEFAKFCDATYGVSCSNGTTALHLAMLALGIKEGDEVITPNFSIISTAAAIAYVGATPVFVDSELQTWNMDVSQIEQKITKKTKAIIVMHTYGCPVDMDAVNAIAKKYKLYVIEDAAEAHGAIYKGRKIGSLSDVACFSFYANKIITCGEGGMVVTNNKEIADKAAYYRNLAFKEPRFIHDHLGYNYRMTNIQAAIGLAQLENAEKLVSLRVNNAELYDRELRNIPGITLPPKCPYGKSVHWMYGILVDEKLYGMNSRDLARELDLMGIQTRTFFYPTHRQPVFKDLKIKEEFPISDRLWEEGIYLPSTSHLSDYEIMRIAGIIRRVAKK